MKRVFTQTFGVAGAILEKDGKILLVREAKSEKRLDYRKWSHPAGWIDVGENPLKAVEREVKEETGFNFKPKYVLGLYSLVRKDKEELLKSIPHAIKIIFIGTFSRKQSKLADDVSAIKWFLPEEIYKMTSSELRDIDIKQMVRDYFSGKKFPLSLITHTISKSSRGIKT